MVHPEDRPRVLQAFEHVMRERAAYDQEFRIVRPNGAIRHVHSLAHPVFDDRNELMEFVGSIVDITERRRAEDALRSTQAELARVSRVLTLGELTASIAHEVMQPLASLIANGGATLRWLAGDHPNLDEGRRGVARMIDDGRRANEVISRIRELASKADRRREQVDVTEAIREVVALMAGELLQNQVTVITQLQEGLPSVVGDRVQLQQVMLNLMINAVEAVSAQLDGAREIRIDAHYEEPGQIHVTVRDSGVGFEPDQIEIIFKSFYTTKPHGMGIGLSISRSIIEAHAGRLWAERNDPDPGTTFSFTLPLDDMP
jgi:C4-dicarboxylate-specific signal transduction histidine kinase